MAGLVNKFSRVFLIVGKNSLGTNMRFGIQWKSLFSLIFILKRGYKVVEEFQGFPKGKDFMR